MEYVIRLADATADLADIERHLVDLDPAMVLDRDAATGALRCSTSAILAKTDSRAHRRSLTWQIVPDTTVVTRSTLRNCAMSWAGNRSTPSSAA